LCQKATIRYASPVRFDVGFGVCDLFRRRKGARLLGACIIEMTHCLWVGIGVFLELIVDVFDHIFAGLALIDFQVLNGFSVSDWHLLFSFVCIGGFQPFSPKLFCSFPLMVATSKLLLTWLLLRISWKRSNGFISKRLVRAPTVPPQGCFLAC